MHLAGWTLKTMQIIPPPPVGCGSGGAGTDQETRSGPLRQRGTVGTGSCTPPEGRQGLTLEWGWQRAENQSLQAGLRDQGWKGGIHLLALLDPTQHLKGHGAQISVTPLTSPHEQCLIPVQPPFECIVCNG